MKKIVFLFLVAVIVAFSGCQLSTSQDRNEEVLGEELTFSVDELLNQRQEGIVEGLRRCEVEVTNMVNEGYIKFENPAAFTGL
jgi:hypothetical protein